MSIEENKALVRRLIEEVWNQGNFATFEELYAPNFIFHDPSLPHVCTREDDKQWIVETLSTFPNFHIAIEDMIADGNQVVVRITGRGTNTCAIEGPKSHPATGKQVTMTGIAIIRLANNQFIEIWHQLDTLGLLQQLGMIPTPGQASKA